LKWNRPLLNALADAADTTPKVLRYHIARLMRELYYGEPEYRGRATGKRRNLVERDWRGRPTPTPRQLAEAVL